jgi:uncharacterized membrane protein
MAVTQLGTRSGLQGSRAQPLARAREALNSGTEQLQNTVLNKVSAERLARGLGWFSIGLGLTELLAPRLINRLAGGHGRHTLLIRLFGLREIAHGLAIFSQGKKPAKAMWGRVAGDALDLTALGGAMMSSSTNKAGVLFATANVVGVAALDVICAQELSRETGLMTQGGAIVTARSVVINRPREEIYQFWHELQNLPRFMYHLESVEPLGNGRSRWHTKAPGGRTVQWESEITADRPNELIAWRSVAGDVDNAGTVSFESRPGGRGTIVRVELAYRPPGGMAGATIAKLFNQSPEQQIYDDLRRLKQVLETGEIVRSDGSPEGTGQVLQRSAQPLPGLAAR